MADGDEDDLACLSVAVVIANADGSAVDASHVGSAPGCVRDHVWADTQHYFKTLYPQMRRRIKISVDYVQTIIISC